MAAVLFTKTEEQGGEDFFGSGRVDRGRRRRCYRVINIKARQSS